MHDKAFDNPILELQSPRSAAQLEFNIEKERGDVFLEHPPCRDDIFLSGV